MASNDEVMLQLDDANSVTVNKHGATVTSWRCCGKEMLFVSKQAVFDSKKAIRGGIPVVFPNFGPWELGPQHGFARISKWAVKQAPELSESGEVVATLSLMDTDATREMWNYKFELSYKLVLSKGQFSQELDIKNTGTDAFSFTTLLHTYFSVADVTKCTVSGLTGCNVQDKILKESRTEDRTLVTISGPVDAVYANSANEHVITNAGCGSVEVVKENLPDTVVWNPWKEGAASMSDFGDDEYARMICVEAGHVDNQKMLSPGDAFHAKQTLKCLSLAVKIRNKCDLL